MPVLAECNVENVCRSRRASNGLHEEQRANLSTLRLQHQTSGNQPLRREKEAVREGLSWRWRRQWSEGELISFDVHALVLLPEEGV